MALKKRVFPEAFEDFSALSGHLQTVAQRRSGAREIAVPINAKPVDYRVEIHTPAFSEGPNNSEPGAAIGGSTAPLLQGD
jgi:hypothetical protein